MEKEHLDIPVFVHHCYSELPVGLLRIDEAMVPDGVGWSLAPGGIRDRDGKFVLLEVSIVEDKP